MREQKKSLQALAVVLCLGAGVLGCPGNTDPSQLSVLPDGGVDFTTFDGLEIIGSLEAGSTVIDNGPLDLATLQLTLLAACWDELNADGTSASYEVCHDDNQVSEIDFEQEDSCHANICAQQLYLCLGARNMELAQTVQIVEFEARPFVANPASSYFNPDGSYDVDLLRQENNQIFSYVRAFDEHFYSIPPQRSQNRTLLFRAATFAFREAGIRGVLASDDSTCSWSRVVDQVPDSISFTPAEERTAESPASIADLYVVGLSESAMRLHEAAQASMRNERSVAATLPGQVGNRQDLVRERWQGEINSESSALALWAGTANIEAAREALPPVVIDGQRAPTRRAIELIRAAGVNIFDETVDDDELLDQVAQVVGYIGPDTQLDVDPIDLLNRFETNRGEFARARQYLIEEHEAFDRPDLVEIPDSGPVKRYIGLQEPTIQPSRDFLISKVATARHNLLQDAANLFNGPSWKLTGVSVLQDELEWDSTFENVKNVKVVEFSSGGSISQPVAIPENVSSLTFSVYLNVVLGGSDLSLSVEACGSSSALNLADISSGDWVRRSVTLQVETPVECGSADVKIMQGSGTTQVALFGAQLERGDRVNALGHSINYPIEATSREYMQESVRNTMSAIRQASSALRGSMSVNHPCADTGDCGEYEENLDNIGNAVDQSVGSSRVDWTRECGPPLGNIVFEVYGLENENELVLVQGTHAYRCMVNGRDDSIDCNDETPEVLASILASTSNETINYSAPPTDEAGVPEGFYAVSDPVTLTSNVPVYLLQRQIVFVPPEDGVGTHLSVQAGWRRIGTYKGCGKVIEISGEEGESEGDGDGDVPYDPVRADRPSALPCAEDILNGYVPPLENELTQDSDPYENSWRHYLNLARRTADEADRLCEELIRAGTENDLRSESARVQLEELCGTSVEDIDELMPCAFRDEDTEERCEGRLSTCGISNRVEDPTYRLPFVSLGTPVCVAVHENWGICRCDETTHDDCQNGYIPACPRPFTPSSDEVANDECRDYLGIDEESAALYNVRYVNDTLNIFRPQQDIALGNLDCSKLREARESAYNGEYWSAWDYLNEAGWINRETIRYAAKNVRLDVRYPNHYELSVGGQISASTFYRAGYAHDESLYDRCPLLYPWREKMSEVPYRRGTEINENINCIGPGILAPRCETRSDIYWCRYENLFHTEGSDYGFFRRDWSERMALVMSYLQALGGVETRDSTESDFYLEDCSSIEFSEIQGGYSENELTGLPLVIYENTDEIHDYGLVVDCCDPRWWPESGIVPDEHPCSDIDFDADCPMCSGMGIECILERGIDDSDGSRDGGLINCIRFERQEGGDVRRVYSVPNNSIWGGILQDALLGEGTRDLFRSGFAPCDYSNYLRVRPFGGPTEAINCGADDIDWVDNSPEARDALWDALELACVALEEGSMSCAEADVTVTSLDDLRNATSFLDCAADELHRDMQRQLVKSIPRVLVDGFRRAGTESYYPGFGGQQLEALLQVERGFRRMSDGVSGIASSLRAASQDVRIFNANKTIQENEFHSTMASLAEKQINAMLNIARAAAGANWKNPGSYGMIGIEAAALNFAMHFSKVQADLAAGSLAAGTESALGQLSNQLAQHLEEIGVQSSQIAEAYREIQTGLGRLESIQREMSRLLSQIGLMDVDSVGRAWPVNTVMNRRYNTLQARYEAARDRAQSAATIARRSIEFRLGVDMTEMTEPMTLVDEAPSTWVDTVCTYQGCDYDRIREASDSFEVVDGEPVEVTVNGENYTDAYIGDYVTRLENFVESYPIDYPFSDSTDTTVISLRELLTGQSMSCWEGESSNFLYFSEDFESNAVEMTDDGDLITVGWQQRGCASYSDSEEHLDRCIGVLTDGNDYMDGANERGELCDTEGVNCHYADLIYDTGVSDSSPRPSTATNTGYLTQTLSDLLPGDYYLDYWIRSEVDGSGTSYLIRVVEDGADRLFQTSTPPNGWERVSVPFTVESFGSDVAVEIHPSYDGISDECHVALNTGCGDRCTVPDESCGLGGIWLSRMQVRGSDDMDADPLMWTYEDYDLTLGSRQRPSACHDPMSFDFQSTFIRECSDSNGVSCFPGDDGCQCARLASFVVSLPEIESGALLQIEPIATHNYNYRHDRVSLNIQGSNIIECDDDDPASCYSNGFVPYTLEHRGTNVPVRNWTGDTVLFDMPTGRIQRGKALAAEVVPTNPLSSNQRNMFQDFWKSELRGRPLQGIYTLRIWEEPGVQWGNVEDIQLLLEYRYWTRFGH